MNVVIASGRREQLTVLGRECRTVVNRVAKYSLFADSD